jgi:hypothetical protein
MRAKDKITFDYPMARVSNQIREVVKLNASLEQAIERNKIMQEINKIAWLLKIRSKESHRINWNYARRHKITIPRLKKLLEEMKIEYVYQQAGVEE